MSISGASNNRVLGRKAPPLNKNEDHLPRPIRAVLAQLRSGFCSRLRDFQFRMQKALRYV